MSSVTAEVRVRYADTDRMGVAYYANYLIWFEVGRNEFMRAKGHPYLSLEPELAMPVVEAHCRYRAPARYDDLLKVETRLEQLGHAQLRFAYRVTRGGDGLLLVTGRTRHAAVGPNGRPRRIPEEVKQWLSQ